MLMRLLMLGLVTLLWSQASFAARDISGSEDHPWVKRFPLSWIVKYQVAVEPEHQVALGPMKKVEGIIAPESSARVQGKVTRITYRIPDGHDAKEVFSRLSEQIKSAGGETLFSCSSRQCGSSNQWANNMFGVAELYGVDRTQSYRVAQLDNSYLALYVVKRGNRRIYAHLDITEADAEVGSSLIAEMNQQGFSWLQADPKDSESIVEAVQPLIEYLAEQPETRVVITGYQAATGESGLAELILISKQYADQVAELLLEAGISADQFDTAGVGPLIPLNEVKTSSGVWVQKF